MDFIIQVLFIGLFLIEGLGMVQNHAILNYFYFTIPAVLTIAFFKRRQPIFFPPVISTLFLIFLMIVLISTFHFSLDKQTSFEYWLLYINIFLIFIYWYNNKEEGKKLVERVIQFGSFMFITAFIVKTLFANSLFIQGFPKNEFNLFFSYASLKHNHLGDFIGLSIIVTVWSYFTLGKKHIISLALFLAIMLYSFSRSAYVSLFLTFSLFFLRNINTLKNYKKHIFFVTIFFVIFLGMSVLLGRGFDKTHPLQTNLNQFAELMEIPHKEIFGARFDYFNQAIQSWKEKPFFGLGAGNFIYGSTKYREQYMHASGSSFNIYFDILAENGIIACIIFGLITISLLRPVLLQTGNLFSPLFIYLFINFQTDYTHKIYGLFTLFFILGAIHYNEKGEDSFPVIFKTLSTLLLTASLFIFTSAFFLLYSQRDQAIYVYPLNKTAYLQKIYATIANKNFRGAEILIQQYQKISPGNVSTLLSFGDLFNSHKRYIQALTYYEKAYRLDRLLPFSVIEKIYLLKKKLYSSHAATNFIGEVFNFYKSFYSAREIRLYYKKSIVRFCNKTKESACVIILPVSKTFKPVN